MHVQHTVHCQPGGLPAKQVGIRESVVPEGYPPDMGLTLPGSLSPSKITAFKNCALAFRFSVIDQIPEPPSPAASKGTLVHRTLQLLMSRPPEQRSLPTALKDLDVARNELAAHPEFAGLGLTPPEWDEFHASAAGLLNRYFELEDPAVVLPIGLELMLTARLGRVTLRGIIDRLELDENGELVVTDYKTGAAPSARYEQSRLLGVHCYALLCEKVLGRRPARVQLLYLSTPEAIVNVPTQQSVKGMERKAIAAWNAIERACAEEDFRPSPGPLCNWCTFKPYCPSWGGNPEQAIELRCAIGPGTGCDTGNTAEPGELQLLSG